MTVSYAEALQRLASGAQIRQIGGIHGRLRYRFHPAGPAVSRQTMEALCAGGVVVVVKATVHGVYYGAAKGQRGE